MFLLKWYTLQESKYYYHLITRETKWVPPKQERKTKQVCFPRPIPVQVSNIDTKLCVFFWLRARLRRKC